MSMPKDKKPTRAAKSRKAPAPLFLLSQADTMLPLVTHIAEDIQSRWQRLVELEAVVPVAPVAPPVSKSAFSIRVGVAPP